LNILKLTNLVLNVSLEELSPLYYSINIQSHSSLTHLYFSQYLHGFSLE